MKRGLFSSLLLIPFLVGCGGGGGNSAEDARRDALGWLERTQAAYERGSRSDFADTVSLNYLDDGADRDDQLAEYDRIVSEGDVRFDIVRVEDARYRGGELLDAFVEYDVSTRTADFTVAGDVTLRREGGRWRNYGDQSFGTRAGAKGRTTLTVKKKG